MRIVLSFLLFVSLSVATATLSGCGSARARRAWSRSRRWRRRGNRRRQDRTAERRAGAPASSGRQVAAARRAHLGQQSIVSCEQLTFWRVVCDGDDEDAAASERFADARIIVVLRGSFALLEGRRQSNVDPTSCLFVAAGQEVRIRHPRGEGDVCLAIGGALAQRLTAAEPDASFADAVRLRTPAATGRRCSRNPAERARGRTSARLRARIAAAARCDDHQARARHRRDNRERDRAALRRSATAARLAHGVGVSPFHAARVFRRVLGHSIHRHQTEVRLRHALALVLDSAARSGAHRGYGRIREPRPFQNRFRRRFGFAPSVARARAESLSRPDSLLHVSRTVLPTASPDSRSRRRAVGSRRCAPWSRAPRRPTTLSRPRCRNACSVAAARRRARRACRSAR